MLTFIFICLMLSVFGKIAWLAVRAAWGLTKIILGIVFLPITLIIMFVSGLTALALPILLVVGLVAFLSPARAV